jgi:hypothetical protein
MRSKLNSGVGKSSKRPASRPDLASRADTQPPDDMLKMFSNPEKQYLPNANEPSAFDASPPTSEIAMSEPPNEDNYAYNDADFDEDYPQASAGFDTIEDEKQDLLYKFYRMQTKGIPISKKYNMSSDIHEMRREYTKITRDMEVNGSIKFSRRMLMACVTGIEFMNKRYDPFDVKLEGWSETVMESMDDYDNVFERLHDKYASKVQMAPEIELLLSITGSAFMFHLTNSLVGNLPNLNEIAKTNPDIISNLMKTMSNVQNTATPPPSATAPSASRDGQKKTASSLAETSTNKEMKGPMFDMSAVMGMFNNPSSETPRPLPPVIPPPAPVPVLPPQIADNQPVNNSAFIADKPPGIERQDSSPCVSIVSSSVESEMSDTVTKTVSVSESALTSGSKSRGRKPKVSLDKTISI